MKFWKIPNPSAVYKSFLFYWALLFKVDNPCPPDVWKTRCCIEVLTLGLAVGAAGQVDHKRHTWSAVWNSCFFFCCDFVPCQKPKSGGRQPRRTGVKRIGKEKKEEEGGKGEKKEKVEEYKQTPHIRWWNGQTVWRGSKRLKFYLMGIGASQRKSLWRIHKLAIFYLHLWLWVVGSWSWWLLKEHKVNSKKLAPIEFMIWSSR